MRSGCLLVCGWSGEGDGSSDASIHPIIISSGIILWADISSVNKSWSSSSLLIPIMKSLVRVNFIGLYWVACRIEIGYCYSISIFLVHERVGNRSNLMCRRHFIKHLVSFLRLINGTRIHTCRCVFSRRLIIRSRLMFSLLASVGFLYDLELFFQKCCVVYALLVSSRSADLKKRKFWGNKWIMFSFWLG